MENEEQKKPVPITPVKQPGLMSLLRPYKWWIILLAILTLASNALNLVIPKIIAGAVDSYSSGAFNLKAVTVEFFFVSLFIMIFMYVQAIVQTVASELVARRLRTDIAAKISIQDIAYIQQATPAKLLTNLTSDVNAVKSFVSQAIASIISSVFLIIGASVLLLMINWELAIAVLLILPMISITFFLVFSRVRGLFKQAQEVIDWLNKVISESILGSAVIRLFNSQQQEYEKFIAANTQAKSIGFSILKLFAVLIPIITLCVNLATLVILVLGGHFVIAGTMSIGNFTAFTSYLAILVFPVIIIGFMSNAVAQAAASYGRIGEVLNAKMPADIGTITADLRGDVAVKNVSVMFGEKAALKDISFEAKAGTKTAIIGPTAAGKTQLLYLLTGLLEPTSGVVEYDGCDVDEYEKKRLHQQVGFVFQDSFLFNLTLRENIAFSNSAKDEDIKKAIDTAELRDFIDDLPKGLDTIVSERGTTLSGGQKQRVMLARALALNPRVLLLDDFTARVDARTEQKILSNVRENYPGITLISVTQKIAPIENYDQIILLMEGEILAKGTHAELMAASPEYVQIFDSQKSTNNYELQS